MEKNSELLIFFLSFNQSSKERKEKKERRERRRKTEEEKNSSVAAKNLDEGSTRFWPNGEKLEKEAATSNFCLIENR